MAKTIQPQRQCHVKSFSSKTTTKDGKQNKVIKSNDSTNRFLYYFMQEMRSNETKAGKKCLLSLKQKRTESGESGKTQYRIVSALH